LHDHPDPFIANRIPESREIGMSWPNNQRQHRTSYSPKDVLPLRIVPITVPRMQTFPTDVWPVSAWLGQWFTYTVET
jgi:hypothetical protein